MNDDPTKKPNELSAASLEEMPELSEPRFRRRPGRGQHTGRDVGEIVAIDAELWLHFGSPDAVNDALRHVVAEQKRASGSLTADAPRASLDFRAGRTRTPWPE